MITQTIALFVDAYRELNARKLFWITMILSILVAGAFALMGINERGFSFLHWTFDTPGFNSTIIPPELFYKFLFASLGIPIWLTWIATILALISTSGIFPDFVTGGSIELMLSKPIGRLRLFITKYCTGLLFVALQVFAFTFASFLVIGFRGKAWEFDIFLAVPIVVVFFSYLFAMCTLLGLITRSTIASLLLTLLFWLGLWALNTTDVLLIAQREGSILRAEDAAARIERQEKIARNELARLEEAGESVLDEDGNLPPNARDELEAVNFALARARDALEPAQESAETWTTWAGHIATAKLVLPKTEETVALLGRYLMSDDEINKFTSDGAGAEGAADQPAFADPRVEGRVEAARRDRSEAWIVGTSLGFEILLLGIGALIFCRRDF